MWFALLPLSPTRPTGQATESVVVLLLVVAVEVTTTFILLLLRTLKRGE